MSQDEFGDETVYINNSFEHEEKPQFEGLTTMINLEKLTQSKTISAEDLHSQMARKVKRITEVVPGVSQQHSHFVNICDVLYLYFLNSHTIR